MSRFVNLEFDGQSAHPGRAAEPTVKDESYYQREAQAGFEAGDFQKALRAYSKILEFSPKSLLAWFGQARALLELEQFDQANTWIDKALEIHPRSAELLAAKAIALARRGDTTNALAFSDAAVSADGTLPYVWIARGDILLTARHTLADYCLVKAMTIAKDEWLVAMEVAQVRARHGQFSMALRPLQQAAQFNPSNFRIWLELGRCQEALGLSDAAEKSFAQAFGLNPECSEADNAISRLSSRGGGDRLREWWRRLKT